MRTSNTELSLNKQFLIFFIVYSFLRIYFYFINYPALSYLSFSALLDGVFFGFRFDLSALMTIFTGFIFCNLILSIRPRSQMSKTLNLCLWHLCFAVQVLFVCLNVVDCHLYSFVGRRTTLDSFAIAQDIKDQAVKIFFQYWHVSFLVVGFAFVLWKLGMRLSRSRITCQKSWWQVTLQFIFLVSFSILAIRGGFKFKPLHPSDSLILQPHALAALALNSTFTLLKTPRDTLLESVDDFSSEEVVRILQTNSKPFTFPGMEKSNVVIFIIESLASEYTGYLNSYRGYTPFLDDLAKKSLIFEHSFSNGRRSIDAVTSILSGVPSFVEVPIITSPYAPWLKNSLPQVLRSRGYQSYFFHGAKNGSMHFDLYAKISGFDFYHGLSEYPKKSSDYDGTWGVYDDPFFQYAKDVLSFRKNKNPFFATVFSLSSHNPFKLPEGVSFPEGSLPIHRSIRYVDDALRKFFAAAKKEPWFENTLFVITGDHTSLSEKKNYQNDYDRFRVPILFFHPKLQAFGDLAVGVKALRPIQHTDIRASVMNFLNIKTSEQLFFGATIFSDDEKCIYNQEYGVWWVFDGKQKVRKNAGKDPVLAEGPDTDTAEFEKNRKRVMAYRQYSINGALRNTWYIKK